jgi:hypothetical protein
VDKEERVVFETISGVNPVSAYQTMDTEVLKESAKEFIQKHEGVFAELAK